MYQMHLTSINVLKVSFFFGNNGDFIPLTVENSHQG